MAAAFGVYTVLGGGDDDASADAVLTPGYELSRTGELPDDVGRVELHPLRGGVTHLLAHFIGRTPVVLNFFAAWCQPCATEMPAFQRVHQDLGSRVSIMGLSIDRESADALGIVERTGVTYPTYGDPKSAALTFFRAVAMPTTVFIDATGAVVEVSGGALSEAELRHKIAEHFGVAA